MQNLTNRSVAVQKKEMSFIEKLYIPAILHGMKITSNGAGGYNYDRINAVLPGSSQWSFDATKNYLLPIPLSILGQNPALEQNPNYQ